MSDNDALAALSVDEAIKALEKSSRLSSKATVTFSSRETIFLLSGRKPTKDKHYHPGLEQYSRVMASISNIYRQSSHPFALMTLLEQDKDISNFEKTLGLFKKELLRYQNRRYTFYDRIDHFNGGLDKLQSAIEQNDKTNIDIYLQGLRNNVKDMENAAPSMIFETIVEQGSDIALSTDIFEDKYTIDLELFSPYAYRWLDLLALHENLVQEIIALKLYGKIGTKEKGRFLNHFSKLFTSTIYKPFHFHKFLQQPITPQDIVEKTENYKQLETIFGPLPKAVLSGQVQPKYI